MSNGKNKLKANSNKLKGHFTLSMLNKSLHFNKSKDFQIENHFFSCLINVKNRSEGTTTHLVDPSIYTSLAVALGCQPSVALLLLWTMVFQFKRRVSNSRDSLLQNLSQMERNFKTLTAISWSSQGDHHVYKTNWLMEGPFLTLSSHLVAGLSWWLAGKESIYHVGDVGSIPGWGRSHGEENGNPFQYSCLGNPMDREVWQATVHGVAKESDMT